MSWDYRIEESAIRDLSKLGPAAPSEILNFLDTRIRGAGDPEMFGKPLRGRLKGLWRYRVRDWRLLCRLERSVLIVVVVEVGHRSTICDD